MQSDWFVTDQGSDALHRIYTEKEPCGCIVLISQWFKTCTKMRYSRDPDGSTIRGGTEMHTNCRHLVESFQKEKKRMALSNSTDMLFKPSTAVRA